MSEAIAKRKSLNLNMTMEDSPWVGRPKRIRGCSRQGSFPNFLHNLIDCRWTELCIRRGVDVNTLNVQVNDWTDARHGADRQLKNGLVTIMSNSLPYWHYGDRTTAPIELLYHQGYGHEIDVSTLAMPVPGLSYTLEEGAEHSMKQGDYVFGGNVWPLHKKRKRNNMPRTLPCPNSKVANLAGQAMCLPDIAAVWACVMLSLGCDLCPMLVINCVWSLNGQNSKIVQLDVGCGI